MTRSNRKPRSDSAAAAIGAAQAALGAPIAVPPHLSVPDAAKPFWTAVTQARAAGEWNDTDLASAADLARTWSDIERLQVELDRDGYVLPDGRINPVFRIVDRLTARSLKLARLLQLHPAGRGIRQSDVAPQRRLEQQARSVAEQLRREAADDDALLA